MSSDKSYRARVQSMPRYYLGGLYHEVSDKTVFLFGQAIAFKVLVTIVPIIILMTGLLGSVLRQAEPFASVSRFIRSFLPPYQSEQLISFLGEFQKASGALTIIGAVGLVMSAFTLVTTVRVAVSRAFEQDWNEERSILGGYAFDLRMVGQVGLFFLLTIGLSVLTQTVTAQGQQLMAWLGLAQSWRATVNTLALVVPFLITTAMFFQLFYFIPRPHPPKTSAGIGALLTALLWEAAKYGFTLYASHAGQFSRYESGEGMAALGNTFGLIVAFVFWAYFSGVVLMIGAIVASLHEQRRRYRMEGGIAPGRKLDAAAHERPAGGAPDAASNGAPPAAADIPARSASKEKTPEKSAPSQQPFPVREAPLAVAAFPAEGLATEAFSVEKVTEEEDTSGNVSEEEALLEKEALPEEERRLEEEAPRPSEPGASEAKPS